MSISIAEILRKLVVRSFSDKYETMANADYVLDDLKGQVKLYRDYYHISDQVIKEGWRDSLNIYHHFDIDQFEKIFSVKVANNLNLDDFMLFMVDVIKYQKEAKEKKQQNHIAFNTICGKLWNSYFNTLNKNT